VVPVGSRALSGLLGSQCCQKAGLSRNSILGPFVTFHRRFSIYRNEAYRWVMPQLGVRGALMGIGADAIESMVI
jgi:hypothetical protein